MLLPVYATFLCNFITATSKTNFFGSYPGCSFVSETRTIWLPSSGSSSFVVPNITKSFDGRSLQQGLVIETRLKQGNENRENQNVHFMSGRPFIQQQVFVSLIMVSRWSNGRLPFGTVCRGQSVLFIEK